jgi:hypothetical protein
MVDGLTPGSAVGEHLNEIAVGRRDAEHTSGLARRLAGAITPTVGLG